MRSLSAWVPLLRNRLGLSRNQLAERMGVPVATVKALEQGGVRASKELVERLLVALAVDDPGERALVARAAGVPLNQEPPALPPEDMRAWIKERIDAADDAALARLFPALWLLFGKES